MIEALLLVVALSLALHAQFQAQGKSPLGWAVIAVCAVLLLGQLE